MAIPGKHYIASEGVITFERGEDLTSFSVEIVDDDAWLPIRDFVVHLEKVAEGRGGDGWGGGGVV